MSEELPEGWVSASLDQVAVLNPRHPKSLDDSMPISFVRMAAVSESKPAFDSLDERALGEVRKGFTHFAEGDVLFAKITPCMENGKGAVATGLRNGIGCGTTELHVIRPLAGIDPHYVFRFLAQSSVRRAAKENFTGTAGQARVPTSFLEALELPLAPLAEQRRIVAKLAKLLAKVDACQERLAKIPVLLKRFRQSVLAAACSGRLTVDWRKNNSTSDVETGDLPLGWQLALVGEVIQSLKYGTSQKCGYEKRGVPVLRIPNIADGITSHSDLKYAELPEREFQQLRLIPGDILLIRSNGSVSLVGKCALVRKSDRDFAYAGYLIRLRPNTDKVAPEFMSLALGSYGVRKQIEVPARSTSGVNNINTDEIRALQLLLPPLPEQQEIVRRVEGLFALADRLEARLAQARAQVDKLTPALLVRAFRGELVPTEAELARREGRSYEPASVLLDRIRAERASETPKQKRGRRAKGA
ncbi:MAG: restriction endonuclease subunit S [Planctomycetes bacterium]|nr:restriction endonuclease subunit S [Planctomycetota bacterium]